MADMKEELKQALQDRAGLDGTASQKAVETVVDFIKQKGPSALSELAGGSGGIGGMLGR